MIIAPDGDSLYDRKLARPEVDTAYQTMSGWIDPRRNRH
jgi:hypothetical protein